MPRAPRSAPSRFQVVTASVLIAAASAIAAVGLLPRPDPVAANNGPAADDEKAYTVSFKSAANSIDVLLNDAPFTTFVFSGAAKPYLSPILAPRGQSITRTHPLPTNKDEDRDHPHHTSMWFAHGNVSSHDFWHAANGANIAVVGTPQTDAAASTITAKFEWRDAAGKAACTEDRIIRFAGNASVRTIDFDLTITAPAAPIIFADTKEGTFALRLTQALNLKGKGKTAAGSILSSTGLKNADCWGKRAAWVEYSGPVDGKHLGVAVFDHPANPRHPTWWHARDYGLLAANPFGAHDFEGKPAGEGDLTIAAGKSVRFRYRILIHDGAWKKDKIDAAYNAYAKTEDKTAINVTAPAKADKK